MEGQQRIDNHSDKLMNYIRYWQASEESIKTSIRTQTRLGQIVQEGHFRGGIAPYGYSLVKRGRLGKKNRELYEIERNEEEAVVVRLIFDIAEKYGYGARKIATEIWERGIRNREGKPFHKLQGRAASFHDAPAEVQKMIVSQMIERVTISRNYELDIQLAMNLEQFMEGI